MPATVPPVRAVVDDTGITLDGGPDRAIDVLFDDRRIFSFWSERDTRSVTGGVRFGWPQQLRRFLDGTVTVSLVDHLTGVELHRDTVRLGSGTGSVTVEDRQGNPLGLDKSWRLMRLFESRDAEQVRPLLDAMHTVLGALEDAGVQPFLAYGTLLGAVRDGRLIGHDSDADLGYVSSFDHPAEAAIESFRLQRRLRAMGFAIMRYSGLAFKVIVREADGSPRGLDVFGGFLRDGQLYLMGEVGHPFERAWLEPRSEVTLEGRAFPAPHLPEHLLEAMYGPTWRVPDPAYKFETPEPTRRRLNGWFRGTRVGIEGRWQRWGADRRADQSRPVSAFVRWVREREPDIGTAIDLGCGAGQDAVWLAENGVHAVGLDYFPRAFRRQARRAAARGLPVSFRWANLSELRSVLPTGAQLARLPGPRVVLARHVADATDRRGREHLLRLAKMATRDGGRLYLQFQTVATPRSRALAVSPLDVDRLVEQVHALGGTVVERLDLDEPAGGTGDSGTSGAPDGADPHASSDASTGPTICRMVITWTR